MPSDVPTAGLLNRERIEWVVFDAVGTLLFPDPPVARAYWESGRMHGSALDETEVGRRFRQACFNFDRDELDAADPDSATHLQTSETHEQRRWRSVVRGVFDDLPDIDACFRDLHEHFARPSAWSAFGDVEPTLRALRLAGLRLGIASNFDGRLHGVLDGDRCFAALELRAISSEVGYRKPSRRFFHAVAEMAGCPAERILFVGDDPANDVDGARAAGMPALQIDRNSSESAADVVADLTDLLDVLACR
ncbi:MAG: HAD-IA family hydrolase [Planctomycetaceae bacterium]